MNILVTEETNFCDRALNMLKCHANVCTADIKERKKLLNETRDVNVLWIRLRHFIDSEVMDSFPNLKIIVTPTTGLNHIDIEETKRRGISIISLCNEIDFLENVRATAEFTIGLILALIRHLPSAVSHTSKYLWNRDLFLGNELCGKTVGIMGYGRLGKIVARYLKPFDVQLLTFDPKINNRAVEPGLSLVAMNTLLSQSDIVTLHVNLNKETIGFFGRSQFEKMKKGAWLINTSRGELIDESALLQSLMKGRLAGAAIDVLCNEHSINKKNQLLRYAREHDNLIITPHIGGCTIDSIQKVELFLAEKLCVVLSSLERL